MGRKTQGGIPRAYADAATHAARTIGDGSIALALTDDGPRVQAIAHRDPETRGELERALEDPSEVAAASGWLNQVATAGYAVSFDLQACSESPVGERVAELAGYAALAATENAALWVVRDRAGRPYSATERAALEAILRRHFGRDDGTLDARATDADVPMWVVDARKRVRHANQAFSEIIGMPVPKLVGMPLAELVERGALMPRPDGEPEDRAVVRADGAVRWLQIHARPLASDTEPGATVYTGFDVTDRRDREVKARIELDCERMLRSFTEFLLTEPPPEEVHKAATALIAQQFGAPLVTFSAIARSLDEAIILAESGAIARPEAGHRRERVHVPDRSIAYEAVSSEELVTVRDYGDPRGYLLPGPVALRAGARSAACAPVGSSMCLAVLRSEPCAIDTQETEFLEGVARVLSLRSDLVAS